MMPPILAAVLVALLCFVVAFDVMAQVSDARGPFDPKLLWTYGWIVGISLLGGVASFYRKVKAGQARWFNLGEFIGELFTSALAGLITFWLCRSSGLNDWWTAALVGVSGHMGSRALFMLEQVFERWANKALGGQPITHAPVLKTGTPGDER